MGNPIELRVAATDKEGDALQVVEYRLGARFLGRALAPPWVLAWTPDASVPLGQTNVTARVRAADGSSGQATRRVIISNGNHAPVFAWSERPDDQERIPFGQSATFTVLVSDPDAGDAVHALQATIRGTQVPVHWDATTGRATVVWTATGSGLTRIDFSATDLHGAASSINTSVIVDQPPRLTLIHPADGHIRLEPGQQVFVELNADDPEGDPIDRITATWEGGGRTLWERVDYALPPIDLSWQL